ASDLRETFGRLPLQFEANEGQTDARVQFLARGPGYTLFLTPAEAVFRLQTAGAGNVVRMELVGANPQAGVRGGDRLAGVVNYCVGAGADGAHVGVPTFGRVEYQDVYPGVGLVYYGNQGQMEYDFVVAPNADPQAITLNFAGVDRLELDGQGDLVLHAGGQ